MIRVLVADDHPVVRNGLQQLLSTQDGIELVGLAQDGGEAVALAHEHRPDVVLMDMRMPGLDGVEATRRVLADGADTRVVVLTSYSDRERILEALAAGATGYLLKDCEPEELLRGIVAAARGESPLAPRAAQVVVGALTGRTDTEPTGRERDVLRLVGEGLPNKLIARELGISEKTVKAHLTSAFRRIGVSDRTQAALWAQRNGLTSDAPSG